MGTLGARVLFDSLTGPVEECKAAELAGCCAEDGCVSALGGNSKVFKGKSSLAYCVLSSFGLGGCACCRDFDGIGGEGGGCKASFGGNCMADAFVGRIAS